MTATDPTTPKVTIGLPVHNGERFLGAAIESLLAQTFEDYELLISDNASTDGTPEICAAYAARDSRIRYERLPQNIGGFRNHNRVVARARAALFTWAAHDDLRAPTQLARCVDVLSQFPNVVLAFTAIQGIDAAGEVQPTPSLFPARVSAPSRLVRFADCLDCAQVYDPHYGVIRTAVLRDTGLLAQHRDSDRVLLAELSLRGPFYRIEDVLFFRRYHAGMTTRQYASAEAFVAWYEPSRRTADGASHHTKLLSGFLASLWRTNLSIAERARCHWLVARWALRANHSLRHEWGFTRSQLVARLRDSALRVTRHNGPSA